MAVKPLATLSTDGWLTDPKMIGARLISNYILTNKSQSLVYRDKIRSLPQRYFEYGKDPDGFAEIVKSDVNYLMRRHFESVESSSKVSVNESGYATVFIYATAYTDDGIEVGLGYISQHDPNGLNKTLIEINGYSSGLKLFGEMQ